VFFYLKLAKHLWKTLQDEDATRKVLYEGYTLHGSDSADIVLALQKFERETRNYAAAEKVLNEAEVEDPRVVMQAVQLQREIGNVEKASQRIEEAIASYGKEEWKMWLIKA
jgi:hypothetical protein